ncbi:peroxidase family protein [Geodermatophilus maliterrae]|uniref:Heme peroxidase family protein n=1 Tax=Geodermatophilus maliterrae TaxID=3162531 RepID=A0ABV3XNG7_9ACTN
MDAQDTGSPVDLLAPNTPSNPNNPDMTAGFTFLGQFLDHDMTFDPVSSLQRQTDPEKITNFRIPALELDSLYGTGPGGSPHLYDQTVDGGLTSFLVEEIAAPASKGGAPKFDLPRNGQLTALVGDPRNDENLMISQLHLAMLRFHNAVVEHVRSTTGLTVAEEIFDEAQRLVRWHYQWIIVHEFLANTVGKNLVEDIVKNGRKFYNWRNHPFIPVEFSAACYRFGHSQVRPSYRANFGPDGGDPFIAMIFDDSLLPSPDPDDLRGGRRASRRFIDWQTFFDFGDNNHRPNKKIDTILSSPLFDLIGIAAGDVQSLAQRNLLRQLALALPSGQRVARAMEEDVLAANDLADLKPFHMDTRTPLWFYVLREADVQADGKRLGPVGGRVVAEVFLGLLQGDHFSYLRQDPGWTPTLSTTGDFYMVDLLRIAGVVSPV